MTSSDDRVQTNIRLPPETKQAIKDADGPMWQILEEGARIVLGLDEGSTEAALEARLTDIRQERSELTDQIEEIEARLDELEEMESELENRLASVREEKASYHERLASILDQMLADANNRPVTAWMSELKEAGIYEYGSDSKQNIDRVIEDLRSHAEEEDIPIAGERLSRTGASMAGGASGVADGGSSDFRAIKGDDDD